MNIIFLNLFLVSILIMIILIIGGVIYILGKHTFRKMLSFISYVHKGLYK